ADQRWLRRATGEVAGDEVLVGVAHAGGGELHQHLVLLRGIELDLLDAPGRVALPQDGCSCSHRPTPPVSDVPRARTVATPEGGARRRTLLSRDARSPARTRR